MMPKFDGMPKCYFTYITICKCLFLYKKKIEKNIFKKVQ